MKTIGVLALQGGFKKHIDVLKRLNVNYVEVRLPNDLEKLDGLILPGGESTTNIKLMMSYDLFASVKSFAESKSVFGTCAGSILMANRVLNFDFPTLELMEVEVERNAYGTQVDSFLAEFNFQEKTIESLFIRAPKFKSIGKNIEVLAKHNNEIIIVKNARHLAATCHPELVDESAVHEYFIQNFI